MFWRKLHHASVSRTKKAGKTLPGAREKRNQTLANHRVCSKTLRFDRQRFKVFIASKRIRW